MLFIAPCLLLLQIFLPATHVSADQSAKSHQLKGIEARTPKWSPLPKENSQGQDVSPKLGKAGLTRRNANFDLTNLVTPFQTRPSSEGGKPFPKANVPDRRDSWSDDSPKRTAARAPLADVGSQPCRAEPDHLYGGVRFDCSGLGFHHFEAASLPSKTTTLILDRNALDAIPKSLFRFAPNLKFLSVSKNRLESLDSDVLVGLGKLEVLNLEQNLLNLDNVTLKEGVFRSLVSLRDLRLASNGNKNRRGYYSTALFDGALNSLHSMSLDAFVGNLDFGNIFSHKPALSYLKLSCYNVAITNATFQHFGNIPLTHMQIIADGNTDMSTIETAAFERLSSLSYLYIRNLQVGQKHLLESLEPFVGRNFSTLHFERINAHPPSFSSEQFGSNHVLSLYVSRFLRQVCVENFHYTHNGIFNIEAGSIMSDAWAYCVKYIDISENPVRGTVLPLAVLYEMKRLSTFLFMNRKYSLDGGHIPNYDDSFLNCRQKSIANKTKNLSNTLITHTRGLFHEHRRHATTSPVSDSGVPSSVQTGKRSQLSSKRGHWTAIIIPLPESLNHFSIAGLSSNMADLNVNIHFKGGWNVTNLNLADTGSKRFTARYTGLENVQKLDVSLNDGRVIAPYLFDTFPSVTWLNMSSMNLRPAFVISGRLFQNLTQLVTLDLSGNGMYFLSPATFEANPKLKALSLAGNRFTSIPFQIDLTPNLCLLLLKKNTIPYLQKEEMQALDEHARQNPSFSLKLHDNLMVCSCSHIDFLWWLKTTHVDLDSQNYSCLTEDGAISTIGSISDLRAMGRRCDSKSNLLVTIVLTCVMALSIVVVFMYSKLQLRFKAFVLQQFGGGLQLKKPNDYPTGVYIGYAREDSRFACFPLRKYIEEKLGLTTYVQDRDLLPSTDMALSIVEAISRSWRIVFVMTEAFLERERWAYFAIKTASYCVSAENCDRVVLLSDEGTWKKIPREFLEVVNEDSFISLENGQVLSQRQKQALRQALLPQP